LRAAVEAVTWRHTTPGASKRRNRRRTAVAAVTIALLGGGAAAAVPLLADHRPPGVIVASSPPATKPSLAVSEPVAAEWIGELQQSFGRAEPVHMVFALDAASGTIRYP